MSTRITLRLPDDLHKALARRAASTGEPVTTTAMAILAESLGLKLGERLQGFAALPTKQVKQIASLSPRTKKKTRRKA